MTASIPCLTIVSHPEASRVGERAELGALATGGSALLSRLEPSFAHPGASPVRHPPRPLEDRHISRKPVRIAPSAALLGGLTIAPDPEGTDLRLDGETVVHAVDVPPALLRRGAVLELGTRAAILVHVPAADPSRLELGHRRDDVARLLVQFLREELGEAGEAELLEQGWLVTPLVARLVRLQWSRGVPQLREAARKIAEASQGGTTMRLGEEVERMAARETYPPLLPGAA